MERILAFSFVFIALFYTAIECRLPIDYNALEAPPNRTDIGIGMVVESLAEVDDRHERITVSIVVRSEWIDERLAQPTNNTKPVHVATNAIWTPPFKLLQLVPSAATSAANLFNNDQLTVNERSGHVHWLGHLTGVFLCKMDARLFPFDQHRCPLTLSVYDTTNPDLHLTPIRIVPDMTAAEAEAFRELLMKAYSQSLDVAEWRANRERIYDRVQVQVLPGLQVATYNVYLARRPYRGVLIWFLPGVVLSSMGVCGIVRWSHRSERFGFGATLCVALTLMLIGLGDRLPLSEYSGVVPVVVRTYLVLFASVVAALLVSGLSAENSGRKGVANGRVKLAVLLGVQVATVAWALFDWYMAN